MTSAEGVALYGVARNISCEGVHLVFDQASAQHLVPLGFKLDPRHPIELNATINLRYQHVMEVCCHIRNVRRLSQDAFSFHLEFIQLNDVDMGHLQSFLNTLPTVV